MAAREVVDSVTQMQARQLGLVTVEQARRAGAYDDWLRTEVARGRLRRIRRGVYAATSAAVCYEQALLAAVLASGTADRPAAASHATAAHALCLPLPTSGRPPIEITTWLHRKPKVEGVWLHRSGHLGAGDVMVLGAIPVTSASRTIIDLSMRFDGSSLGRALDEALKRRLLTLGRLQRDALRLRVAPGRSMHRVLALVVARTGEDASESLLEDFAIEALQRFRVRPPTAQHPVRPVSRRRRIDLAYPAEKVAIEVLGYEHHGRRSRFDEDAVRNNELVRAGYMPLFVTSAMTDWDVAATVAHAIGRSVPPRPKVELTFHDWRRKRGL